MHAQQVDLLSPMARTIWDDAQRLDAAGDRDRAILRLRTLWGVSPGLVFVPLELGRLLEEEERWSEAEGVYRSLGVDPDGLTALVDLLIARDRHGDALLPIRTLHDRSFGSPEPFRLEAQVRLHLDRDDGPDAFARWWAMPGVAHTGEDARAAVGELVRWHARRGAPHTALVHLDALLAADAGARTVFVGLRDELELEALARRLAAAPPSVPLTIDQRRRVVEAETWSSAGRHADALAALEQLVSSAPAASDAHGALGAALERAGDPAGAVLAYAEAEAREPLDARWGVRTARILETSFAGQADPEARAAWERVMRKAGAPHAGWLSLAELRARTDDVVGAAAAAATFLEGDISRSDRERATALIAGASRRPPELRASGGAAEVDPVRLQLARARVWAEQRGDPVAALALLDEVDVDDDPVVAAFEGALALEAGDWERADRALRRAVELAPDDPYAWSALARATEAHDPRAALAAWRSAAALGSCEAAVTLAQGDLARFRPWQVEASLSVCVAPLPAEVVEVEAVRGRAVRFMVLAGAGVLVGAGALAAARQRRRWQADRAVDLAGLVEAPAAVADEAVAVLAALRHEVVKHHLTGLVDVADAIDRGDHSTVTWAAERLFADDGPLIRFDRYVARLVALAARWGRTLDPRADAALGPLITGLEDLARHERELLVGGGPASGRSVRIAARVAVDHGLRDLARVIQSRSLLDVSADRLRQPWARVVGEPGRPPGALEVSGAGPSVRIEPGDLDDVLANLYRNALDAGAARVGVRLAEEIDWVTGLSRLEIRVCDDLPSGIDTATLRGRYVERGLGLAVDLTSRAGGSMAVEPEDGWGKAVVVRLPGFEREEDA